MFITHRRMQSKEEKIEQDLLEYWRSIYNSLINKIQDYLYIIDNIMYAQKLLDNPMFRQDKLEETRQNLFNLETEYNDSIKKYNELCIEHNKVYMKRIPEFKKMLYQQITIYKSNL